MEQLSFKKKIVITTIATVLIVGIAVGCIVAFTGKTEEVNVRDMGEIVKRGSFVMSVDNQKGVLPDTDKTYVFKTYEEFIENSISNLITYNEIKKIKEDFVEVKYKAKNERYNKDYFENNDLLIAFFNESEKAYNFVINNVRFIENHCEIDVYASTTDNWDQERSIRACFIECKEIDKNIEATVNVCDVFKMKSSINFCFNSEFERINISFQQSEAYFLSDFEGVLRLISDNPNIADDDPMLRGKYDERFFSNNSLMVFILPGEYMSSITVNDNMFNGIRFYSDHYSDHYITESDKDSMEGNLNYACVISVPVKKSFNYDEIQYGYTCYYEWEEGSEKLKDETAPVTLKAQETESGYVKYVLKTGE